MPSSEFTVAGRGSDRGHVSIGNSSTATLTGDAVFTGTAEIVSDHAGISVFAYSDVASAANGLSMQSSSDGTNWDSQLNVSVAAATREIHTLAVVSKYFRIVYTNGSAAQSEFRLQVIYTSSDGKLTSRMSTVISDDYDVQLVRNASDPKLDRAAGLYSNQSIVHKFGANPSVSASSTEDVTFSGTINWLQAATSVRIKAGGNAADDASGNGARKVTVEGLDENWADVSETITTNGSSESTGTTATFIRVFRAYVTDVGVYTAANTGNIVIENAAGGTDLITIAAGEGQTETSEYTVPAGKTAYLTRFTVEVDGNKAADVKMFQRRDADDFTAPVTGKRLVHAAVQLIGAESESLDSYISFPAKTDLWWAATTGGGSAAAVAVDYDLILVDN